MTTWTNFTSFSKTTPDCRLSFYSIAILRAHQIRISSLFGGPTRHGHHHFEPHQHQKGVGTLRQLPRRIRRVSGAKLWSPCLCRYATKLLQHFWGNHYDPIDVAFIKQKEQNVSNHQCMAITSIILTYTPFNQLIPLPDSRISQLLPWIGWTIHK
jgi:hypothetical protein